MIKEKGESVMHTKKTCFIITPISNKDSDIRKEVESIIDNAIIPALDENFDVKVAHRESNLGSISNKIIERIYESELIITNLTGLNTNVMYELGIAHALCKPVIMIAEAGTKLPFDITAENTLFFSRGPSGIMEIEEGIKEIESRIDYEKASHSPVYSALRANVLEKKLQETSFDIKNDLFSFWESTIRRLEIKIDGLKTNIKETKESPLHKKVVGWQEDEISWVYFDRAGEMKTKVWEKSGDHWFYLGADGHIAKDQLIEHEKNIYYVDENGAMVQDRHIIKDGKSMYFGEDGKLSK
ncbi:MAG TPA: hypothetical protein DEQ64_21500 [Lachnoclostridium sp.]|nr:hypothetical protein [Lachnoclostridium sp.]